MKNSSFGYHDKADVDRALVASFGMAKHILQHSLHGICPHCYKSKRNLPHHLFEGANQCRVKEAFSKKHQKKMETSDGK